MKKKSKSSTFLTQLLAFKVKHIFTVRDVVFSTPFAHFNLLLHPHRTFLHLQAAEMSNVHLRADNLKLKFQVK